jgi:hypothetical protein
VRKRGGHLKRGGFVMGVLLGAGVAAFSYLQGKPRAPDAAPMAPVRPPARSVVLPREPTAEELPPRAAMAAPAPAPVEAATEPARPVAAPAAKHHRAVKTVALKPAVTEGMEAVATPPSTSTNPNVAAPPAEPAPRGAREVLADAEKLLAQGEVGAACARGEEARQMSPKLPAISRFLGKCYMRAGNVPRASERYKTYLELAPDAPDAAFIKSIVK